MEIETLFATQIYRAPLGGRGVRELNAALAASAAVLAVDDGAGRRWCAENRYQGYTSYASLDDLVWRDPAFARLTERLLPHAQAFAAALELDLGGRALAMDSLWVNVLEPGGAHSGHIHPLSVLSGTYYVEVPPGSGGLRLEDPRLPLMMAAPPRRAGLTRTLTPKAGQVVLWESWLRHEVLAHTGDTPRISVSFNLRVD